MLEPTPQEKVQELHESWVDGHELLFLVPSRNMMEPPSIVRGCVVEYKRADGSKYDVVLNTGGVVIKHLSYDPATDRCPVPVPVMWGDEVRYARCRGCGEKFYGVEAQFDALECDCGREGL